VFGVCSVCSICRNDRHPNVNISENGNNKKFFPVADGVIKHVIHERHRHQREELLNARRGANWIDNDKRRKHANSRRNDVSF